MKRKRNRTASENTDEISGIIAAADWDHMDRVTAVKFCATDDEEYWIENSEKFIELVQSHIQATGVITRGKKGNKKIYIKRYTLLS